MPQNASLFFSDLEKKGKQHERERERVSKEGKAQARASSSSSSRRGKKARAFVLAKGPCICPPVLEFPTPRFLAVHQCLLKRSVGLVNYPRGTWAGTDRPALDTGGKEGGKMRLSLSLSCASLGPAFNYLLRFLLAMFLR
jgi:hypothetical protein